MSRRTQRRIPARDILARRIPARFRRYDEALARRAFATVVLLRFIFWMPPLLHAFFGVSRVRFWTHFWGSFLGYLLPLFLMSFFGQQLFEALKAAPPWAWAAVGAGVVAVASFAWYLGRVRAARRTAPASPP